jgi:membrane dipeptidase
VPHPSGAPPGRINVRAVSKLTIGLFTLAALFCSPAAPEEPLARAERLMARTPLVDGHNDLPYALMDRFAGDPISAGLDRPQDDLMTDLVKIRQGRLGGQFWSCWVPPSAAETGDASRLALQQIDLIHRLVAAYPADLQWALTADELRRVHRRGRVGCLIGVEGGHMIENSLAVLRDFYRLGARYMTLTHSDNTDWADSATDDPRHGGLTRFGEEVVREMNRLGMLVDLSHVSDGTMHDALRIADAPVIFSHSSARGVADHVRNVPDDVLKLVGEQGGVVMVTFAGSFVSPEAALARRGSFQVWKRLSREYAGDPQGRRRAMDAWYEDHPAPDATLAQVADHLEHIREVAGIGAVGIGSDFDGISHPPVGLEDVSRFPHLVAEMVRRGWSDDEIAGLLGENLLRVLAESERVARRLQARRLPSTATIEELDREPAASGEDGAAGESGA